MSKLEVSVISLVVFATIIIWDLYLNFDKVKDNTISARARALGRWWPPARLILALAIGLVLGHFFWSPQDVYDVGGVLCRPAE